MTSRPYAEIVGDPVDQSLAPLIHGHWLEQLGLDLGYRRKQVGRADFTAYLEARQADPDWRGSNIVPPLKLDALTFADRRSDMALGTGAANLLLPREEGLVAANTDSPAVTVLIESLAKRGASLASVTLLGSGNAARAALMGLKLLNIRSVCIQSRDGAEAYKLAVQFGLSIEPRPFHAPISSDGLINATPLGMAGQPPLGVGLSNMPDSGWVFDFVTNPNPTVLVAAALERGLHAVGGIDMLIEQAAASFKLLFGADPPRDTDAELVQKLSS